MKIKNLVDEDIINYKKTSMYIQYPFCDFKCDKEAGCDVCQNSQLALSKDIEITADDLIIRYLNNPLTHAIVCAGLEPILSFNDLLELIEKLRNKYSCDDTVIIYTGYYKNEIQDKIDILKQYKNIIIKFGRFIPNRESHFDPLLGVNLASDNQYAEQIS